MSFTAQVIQTTNRGNVNYYNTHLKKLTNLASLLDYVVTIPMILTENLILLILLRLLNYLTTEQDGKNILMI